MPKRFPALVMSSMLCLLMACGGGSADDATADALAAAPDGEAAMAVLTEPMELTEKDVEQFVSVMTELRSLGERYGDDGDINNIGAAIMANQKAHAIVRKHGYADVIRFQRVVYNISAAMAAHEMGDDAADVAANREQLEAMKSQLPKEQYDMMVKAHDQMAGMVTGQSAGNKALVARWADRIRAATED